MLDLETLGTAPGSVILSIGAVHFGGGEILNQFNSAISIKSSEAAGLKTDGATMLWWMQQSEAARRALSEGQKKAGKLFEVLQDFNGWLADCAQGDYKNVMLWGNGASFDNTLLAAAYRACDLRHPWRYANERCYRTVKALHPEITEDAREGTHHDALADAIHQAKHLMKILPHL